MEIQNPKPNNVKTETMHEKKDPEKVNSEKCDLGAPEDRYKIIYMLFFFLGLVHLLPWTFFTTATKYWMYKFRNTTINDTNSELRTTLQATFNASLKIVLQVTELIFLTLAMLFAHHVRVRVRMVGLLSIVFLVFVIITIFVNVDTDSWQEGFFVLVMAVMAIMNASNSTFTITMYTVLAAFPKQYLAPYLSGGGIATIFTACLQILSLTLGLSTVGSALVYFCIGLFVIVTTLSALIATGQNKFYSYHMRHSDGSQKEKMITFSEIKHLVTKIWPSVVITAFTLLTVDASPAALVVSEGEGNGPWNDTYFIPTITYLMASLCSQIGRLIAFKYLPPLSSITWTIITFIRTVVFVPLLMLCNAQPRNHLPVWLPHDYQYIILLATLNISGGYLSTLCTYSISKFVKPEELKCAYHVNMFFLGIWMAAFSFVGIVSVKIL